MRLELAKVVSLDRSWSAGLADDILKFFKCSYIFLTNILSGTAKNHAYFKCEKDFFVN